MVGAKPDHDHSEGTLS